MSYTFKLSVSVTAEQGAPGGRGAKRECAVIFADGVLPEHAPTADNAIDELLCRMGTGSGVSVQ